jgi:Ty3 transposon capsid-like protein/Zinc knuckle
LGGEPTERPTDLPLTDLPLVSTSFEQFNTEHLWGAPATRTEPEPETEPEETTDTQDSFATVPEISEPTERLFNALLGQTNVTNINTITNVPNPTTMTTPAKPTELKLSPPKAFSGKRNEFDRFIQDVKLYLELNEDIYDNDKKKIAYALSFMNEGDAESWKGQFITAADKPTGLALGTWANFNKELGEAFKPYDAPGDALEQITALKMGGSSIEDHIARYKVLLQKADIKDDSPAAIDYFRKSLNIPLQKNLLSLPTPPKTLAEWYEWAQRLDNNYRKMQRIFNRNPKNDSKNEPRKGWNFPRKERDPNAMDIDALTVEKREEMMRKGQCFGCGETGHLNRDCPKKKKPAKPFSPKKMGAKELYTHIRSLTALMNDEEKEEFYQEAEKEGF